MAHIFRTKSFIADASALASGVLDMRGNLGIARLVGTYLDETDAGGASTNIDEVLSVTSCKLNGDRVFVLVVLQDQTGSG